MKKRWILLWLTVLFLWVVVSRFTELEQLKNTWRKAWLRWSARIRAMHIGYQVT